MLCVCSLCKFDHRLTKIPSDQFITYHILHQLKICCLFFLVHIYIVWCRMKTIQKSTPLFLNIAIKRILFANLLGYPLWHCWCSALQDCLIYIKTMWMEYGICIKIMWMEYGICINTMWMEYGICIKILWMEYGICIKIMWLVWYRYQDNVTGVWYLYQNNVNGVWYLYQDNVTGVWYLYQDNVNGVWYLYKDKCD